jgi:hypothetical protein
MSTKVPVIAYSLIFVFSFAAPGKLVAADGADLTPASTYAKQYWAANNASDSNVEAYCKTLPCASDASKCAEIKNIVDAFLAIKSGTTPNADSSSNSSKSAPTGDGKENADSKISDGGPNPVDSKGGAPTNGDGGTGGVKKDPTTALDFFQNNALNYSSRAVVATSDILAAEANAFDGKSFPLHTIGILFTGSVPVNNPTSTDFLTSELLQKDGGIGNLFLSFHSRPREYTSKTEKGKDPKEAKSVIETHPYRVDKSYFVEADEIPKYENELLAYYTNGWGGRMYKAITAPGSPTKYYGMATGYVGLGTDGFAKDDLGSADGSLALEGYVTGNYANANTLDTLYGVKGAKGFFSTADVALKLNVGSFTISLSYGTSLTHSTRNFAKDVSSISVSYKAQATPKTN